MTNCSGCQGYGSVWRMPNGAHNGEITDLSQTSPKTIGLASGVAEVKITAAFIDGTCVEENEECLPEFDCSNSYYVQFITLDEGWRWVNDDHQYWDGDNWSSAYTHQDVTEENTSRYFTAAAQQYCDTQHVFDYLLHNDSTGEDVERVRFSFGCSECAEAEGEEV